MSGPPDPVRRAIADIQRLSAARRFADAVTACDAALSSAPSSAELWTERGHALRQSDEGDGAIDSYKQAALHAPKNLTARFNLGFALAMFGQHEEALNVFEALLRIQPHRADARLGRAQALERLGRYDEAVANLDLIKVVDGDLEMMMARSAMLGRMGRYADALTLVDAVLSFQPNYFPALSDKGLVALTVGDDKVGWRYHEVRLQKYPLPWRAEPEWRGNEPIESRSILVRAEQGLGDSIQFSRLARVLADRGAEVHLEVQPPLMSLFASTDDRLTLHPEPAPPTRFDMQIPALSLPLALGMEGDVIPGKAPPYVFADPARVAEWRARVDGRGPHVGLVWSGNPHHENDWQRSIPFATLAAQLAPSVQFIALQDRVRDSDEPELAAMKNVQRFDGQIRDFSDTAALVELCDLVISVDTSVAHLAGAMNKPLWLLIPFVPDFRWRIERADTPWYPSAKLYRQPKRGDWQSVLERVRADLAARFP